MLFFEIKASGIAVILVYSFARYLFARLASQWLAVALFLLVLPINEFEYYAGAILAVGISYFVFMWCHYRSVSCVIISVIWIAYSQYLSIHNTRGIGMAVMILLAVSIWVGQLNSRSISDLMRSLSFLPVPILILQLIGFCFGKPAIGEFFYDKSLGGLSISQAASFVGLMMISSIYGFYLCLTRSKIRLSEIFLAVTTLVSCFVMAFFLGQRSAYLIPLLSVAICVFVLAFVSSGLRVKVGVSISSIFILFGCLVFSIYVPSIGSVKLGFASYETVRVDAIHCVLESALQSPFSFIFGHGFRSFSDQCRELNGLINYHPSFENIGHTHNLIAQVVFSLGVPLGCSLVIFLLKGFLKLLDSLGKYFYRENLSSLHLFLLFNFCFLNSMVEVSFLKVPALSMIYGLIFGAAIGCMPGNVLLSAGAKSCQQESMQ